MSDPKLPGEVGNGAERATQPPSGRWPARLATAIAAAGVYVAAKAAAGRWDEILAGSAWVPPRGSSLRPFVQHALGGTLVAAAICLAGWWVLWRLALLPSPRRLLTAGPSARRTVIVGLACAAAVAAYTLAFAVAIGIPFQFRPMPWTMAGNVLSNLFEEIVYRGFLIQAGVVALGHRHLAIAVSALVFAAAHEQYPWEYRVVMLPVAWLFAFAAVRAGSLLAPWIAHQVLDVVADTVLDA